MQKNGKLFLVLPLVTAFFFNLSRAQSAEDIQGYIARYKDLAISEMQRTGIPAAITLAQGIHETEAGTSELVKKSNNHFGIKCKDNWAGESVSHDDDARGECFRKYAAAEESYRDHSDFLRARSNYASLFQLDPTDYRDWAYGLKRAGYATNPKYAHILIKLIEDYHLQDYTLVALGKMKTSDPNIGDMVQRQTVSKEGQTNARRKTNPVAMSGERTTQSKNDAVPAVSVVSSYPQGDFKINETRVVYVRKGTAFLAIAQQYEIPLARLFEFNDTQPQEIAATDQLVYIQRKRKIGDHEFHVVQPGETLASIAQTEALRLESLLEYNNLTASMRPAVGETLNLRSKSSSLPRLTSNSAAGR